MRAATQEKPDESRTRSVSPDTMPLEPRLNTFDALGHIVLLLQCLVSTLEYNFWVWTQISYA